MDLRYNIIPLPISRMVESFDLQIPGTSGKLFFPHNWNRPENYGIAFAGPPPSEFYSPHTMKPKHREKFFKWWSGEKEKGEPWILREKLVSYCRAGGIKNN